MKYRVAAVIIVLLALQVVALFLIWGTPEQQVQRSYTPSPQPLLPTSTVAPSRTPLPVIPLATMPAPAWLDSP